MLARSYLVEQATNLFCDWELVRAGITRPFVVSRFCRDDKEIGAIWAEKHIDTTGDRLLRMEQSPGVGFAWYRLAV